MPLVGVRLLLAVGDVPTSLPHFIQFLCRFVKLSLRNTSQLEERDDVFLFVDDRILPHRFVRFSLMTISQFGEGAAAEASSGVVRFQECRQSRIVGVQW